MSPDTSFTEEKCSSVLGDSMAKATTRAEVAVLHSLIPPVSARPLAACDLNPVYDTFLTLDDPFALNERPCESVVERAEDLLSDERKEGKNPSGIDIKGMGRFSEDSLAVLRQFCTIADTNRKVSSEAHWLSQVSCSSEDLVRIQDALWHQSASSIVLRFGKKSIDVTSFSDLVEERYIDSFVLNISISKYLEEARENGQGYDTLYFPTECFEWLKSHNRQFKERQVTKITSRLPNSGDLQQILLPVHMLNHWGLIVIDLADMEMYFDDGLASVVPRTALPAVGELLDLLVELQPLHPAVQTRFWKDCNGFKRSGMPSQQPVDSRKIGVGSCRVKLIMAARDFLQKGSPSNYNCQWRYRDMDVHRKNLMLQILNWSV